MAVGRCLNCQAELPEAGRFCVMCGKRVGHAVRERSSDRRVYTSPLGHSVPKEVVIEIQKNERSGELPSMRSGDAPLPESPEERRHITSRTRKKSDAAMRELWRSLLWAVLLSTLGAVVAWGVYAALHRAASSPPGAPPPSDNRPQVVARGPAPVRPKAPAPPPVVPSRPAPGRELVIPIPATASAVPPPSAVGASPLGMGLPQGDAAAAAQNNDIDFVASQHSPQVRACYDRAFRNAGDKAPAGRVELSFVLVDKDGVGRAEQVLTELNMLGDRLVASCLEELVGEWRFPRPPAQNPPAAAAPPRRLRYPFVFTPAPQ